MFAAGLPRRGVADRQRVFAVTMAAVCPCRESTYVFGSSGRRSASATKTHVGVRQAHCGARVVTSPNAARPRLMRAHGANAATTSGHHWDKSRPGTGGRHAQLRPITRSCRQLKQHLDQRCCVGSNTQKPSRRNAPSQTAISEPVDARSGLMISCRSNSQSSGSKNTRFVETGDTVKTPGRVR